MASCGIQVPNPLANRIAAEYTPGQGIHFPDTGFRGRGITPSYASATMQVTHVETITIPILLGSIAANGSTTVSGSKPFSLSSLNLSPNDTAQILFMNTSVSAPANVIVSHPNLTVTSQQGTTANGLLTPGQSYQNLSIKASVYCASIPGSSAGTLTISAAVLVIGTQTG